MADHLKQNPQFGYKPAALMLAEGEDAAHSFPFPVFSFENNLKDIIAQNAIDTIVVSESIRENKSLIRMFFEIIPLGIAIVEFPECYESITGKIPVSLIHETWCLATCYPTLLQSG